MDGLVQRILNAKSKQLSGQLNFALNVAAVQYSTAQRTIILIINKTFLLIHWNQKQQQRQNEKLNVHRIVIIC